MMPMEKTKISLLLLLPLGAFASVNGVSQSAALTNQVSQGLAPHDLNTPSGDSSGGNQKIMLPDLSGEDEKDPASPAKASRSHGAGFNSQGVSAVDGSLQPFGVPYVGMGSGANNVNPNHLPGMSAPLAQKAIPAINLGGAGAGAGASIGPAATDIRFEAKDYLGHMGLSYLTPGSNYGLGVKADGAYLLGKTLAVGVNLMANKNLSEAVLSSVWMPEGTDLKTRISASYMAGKQVITFRRSI
jgi:hypothetical protein